MARSRIPHGATDSALAKLHEAISRPDRLAQIAAELGQILRQVANFTHRQFLERKLHEIERMQKSPHDLARIATEIDTWADQQFPVQGK